MLSPGLGETKQSLWPVSFLEDLKSLVLIHSQMDLPTGEPGSPALQIDFLPTELSRKHRELYSILCNDFDSLCYAPETNTML